MSSGFVRQPLLKPEVEATLKSAFTDLWLEGKNGAYIADKLEFGVPGSPYEKVKPNYVYFYRQKFGLPTRREGPTKMGESRYKHSPKDLPMMSQREFEMQLDAKVPCKGFFNRRKRTFLILHFYSPLRVSEIFERRIEDFKVQNGFLTIHLLRKKKKYKKTVTDEPIEIPLAFRMMDEVVAFLENGGWGGPHNLRNRPWRISHTTAWKYVNSVFEGYYPHFFRFEFITQGLEDPVTNVAEIISITGLHFVTIQRYIATGMRHQRSFNQRRLARMESERGSGN